MEPMHITVGAMALSGVVWGLVGYLAGRNHGFYNAVKQWNGQLGKAKKFLKLKEGVTKRELIKSIRGVLGDDWRDQGSLMVNIPENYIMFLEGALPQGDTLQEQ